MEEKIVGIQNYFQDEWVNTKHKSLDSLRKEAKQFGNGEELQPMHIDTSWFHNETYYYMDTCGHTILFRVITEFNKEYWKEEEKVIDKIGNENFGMTVLE